MGTEGEGRMHPLSRPLVCRPVPIDRPTSVWGRSVRALGCRAPWRMPCGIARPDPGEREEKQGR